MCDVIAGAAAAATAVVHAQLFEIIKRGEYYFHEDAWGGVSERAKASSAARVASRRVVLPACPPHV